MRKSLGGASKVDFRANRSILHQGLEAAVRCFQQMAASGKEPRSGGFPLAARLGAGRGIFRRPW